MVVVGGGGVEGKGEGVSARGRMAAGALGCSARERTLVHENEHERKNEAIRGVEVESPLPPRRAATHSLTPLPPCPPCLFPSFWILYRERYAKVCMHEGRSNGQESREFVRSTAARIRTGLLVSL
jgi:hypothetical protein